jgi:hypothetical protein
VNGVGVLVALVPVLFVFGFMYLLGVISRDLTRIADALERQSPPPGSR